MIKLVDSEDIDRLREEQIKGQKIDNATKMYGMGFDVATDGEGEFIFSQFPNPERQSMMMGGPPQASVGNGSMDKQKKSSPKNNMKNGLWRTAHDAASRKHSRKGQVNEQGRCSGSDKDPV